ncbi:MAG: heavy-metal-associated domain-containing protein [Hyphomicrobiales bacterium]|nr:heavy-metal-associated domain-containing protein [Hyphomicrobiales bacterium]
MKRTLIVAVAALSLGGGGLLSTAAFIPGVAQAQADQIDSIQTLTFTVERMTCGLCRVTVAMAMEGVEGVHAVAVDLAAKAATVEFDPSVTSADAIAAASTNAGYPAGPAS